MPRDTSCVFIPGQALSGVAWDPVYAGPVSPYCPAVVDPAPTIAATGTTSDADHACIVREFLEDTGVLSLTEGTMIIIMTRAYLLRL